MRCTTYSRPSIFVVLSCLAAINLWSVAQLSAAELAPERLGQSSRLTSLVVSEIMYHPAARADGKDLEFIELFNTLETPEDISGYRITGDVTYTFPQGTVIPGRSFLAVARKPADVREVYGLETVLGPFAEDQRLSNNQGVVELRHRLGALLLSVEYDTQPPWPIAPDGAGHSLVLARPSFGEHDAAAWEQSALIGGSPGSPEPVVDEPANSVVINEFLARPIPPGLDYIELFNRSNREVDISGCVLTDDADLPKFILPLGTRVPAGGFIHFTEAQLQFALSSAGETIYFVNSTRNRVLDAVRFGGQMAGVATGRFPDGSSAFYPLENQTPGARNSGIRVGEVVINELMFHPITEDDGDQFVELHNRGAAPIDIGGWRLEDGVDFTFPAGTVIGPKGFVVVAKHPARLLPKIPGLNASNTFGPFGGRLSRSGERVALNRTEVVVSSGPTGVSETNLLEIVVDEVTYRDGGRWGTWSDGGGSSLERIDPRADGRLPSNWADSLSPNAPWTQVSFTGRLDNGNVSADQLQVLLQGAGECLIDNVEVIDSAGVNLVANGSFESGASSWTAEGTESESSWESGQGYESVGSYHVRAVERSDNQLNRIRTRLTSPLQSGTTATI